jgi:predicted ATPase/DNA-binding SARP family transcriptional activator
MAVGVPGAFFEDRKRAVDESTGSGAGEQPGDISQDALEKSGERGPMLRIYVLGHFRIENRGEDRWVAVTNRTWQRRRVRALLGCLLSNSGRRLRREQAMEALWPDVDLDTAANRLNGAVHEVRQVLEPGLSRPADSRLLRLERDMLILADASLIWVDADAFEKLVNKANSLTDAAQVEQTIEEALALYGGDYLLEELYSEWAAPRREALRRSWMGLLLRLAELRANRGALTSAIEPLDRLLTAEPTHETGVRRLMELLTQLDRRGEAFQVYHRLVETLRRDYDSEPLPETTALYRALREGTYQIPQPATTSPMPSASPTPSLSQMPPATSADSVRTGEQDIRSSLQHIVSFPRPVLQLGRHNQSRLVGRGEELATMQRFLQDVEGLSEEQKSRRRLAHLLLLSGEAGIGKTRLAEELSYEADQRGWSVVWARSYEQEAAIPYRPWAEIFRVLLKDIHPSLLLQALEAQARRLPAYDAQSERSAVALAQSRLARMSTLVPELSMFEPYPPARESLSLTPEQERLHLWEAACAILSILSQPAPLLLVLDDLHWTDDSSLGLLAYMVRHMQGERIAIVATCRDGELVSGSTLSILIQDLRREQAILALAVEPLNDVSIGSLVSHLPEHIVKGIQLQAGGNPFFAEELARVSEAWQNAGGENKQYVPGMVLEMDMAGTSGLPGMAATPETIRAVLDRRLSKLSSDCQVLLGKAAVLGGSFTLSQLTFLAGEQGANEESIFDLLEEALHAGLLTEEGAGTGSKIVYHFWHPLIVTHLYERHSAARRAQLHRKAAQALIQLHRGSEEEVAATITYHLIRGGSDMEQVGYYAELAGNRAYALYAYSEAEHYYRLAIDALAHAAPTRQSKDPLHLASILERIAECTLVHGDFEEMRRLYERVLALRNEHCSRLAGGISREEAQRQALIWCEIGRTWSENANMEEATRCCNMGQQVMVDAGVLAGAAWACLELLRGTIDWRLGNNETARQHVRAALETLEHIMQQEPSQLPITNTELPTRTALAMIGSPYELGRSHEVLGIIAATKGEFAEALTHLKQALAIYERHDLVTALIPAYGNLAGVYATKAEYDTASINYQRALEMARRDNNLPMMAWVYGNLGETAARRGYLSEAKEQMQQSLVIAEQVNDPEQASWTLSVLAIILCDLGEMPAALAHTRRGLKLGRAVKSVTCIGMALLALGVWRIIRAMQVSQIHLARSNAQHMLRASGGDRLLHGAAEAIRRALSLEGLGAETVAEARLALASTLYLQGEIDSAFQVTMQALHESEQHELMRITAQAQRLLSRIMAAKGRDQEADAYAEQALAMFSQHGMRLDYARALYGHGVTLLRRGKPGSEEHLRGLGNLREAREMFAECGASIDQGWVERILSDSAYENAGV